jgi:hypothetical protein
MSDLSKIDTVAGIPIYAVSGTPRAFIFKAALAINADGSPNAYGPNNSGLDYTANGGDDSGSGDWWGGPTGSDNKPIVQTIYDPSPGLYVSGTALINSAFDEASPYRYIDSESIPFFVLPGKHSNQAKLGDVGLLYNETTGDNCYAIYGDVGPQDKLGECSIRLAQALGVKNLSPKDGGLASKTITYLVFYGSVGKWQPPNVWWKTANDLTSAWGGLSRLVSLSKGL